LPFNTHEIHWGNLGSFSKYLRNILQNNSISLWYCRRNPGFSIFLRRSKYISKDNIYRGRLYFFRCAMSLYLFCCATAILRRHEIFCHLHWVTVGAAERLDFTRYTDQLCQTPPLCCCIFYCSFPPLAHTCATKSCGIVACVDISELCLGSRRYSQLRAHRSTDIGAGCPGLSWAPGPF